MNVDHSERYPPTTADTISASKTLKPVILFVYFNTVFLFKKQQYFLFKKHCVFQKKIRIFLCSNSWIGLGILFFKNSLQRCASGSTLILLYTAKIAEMNELDRWLFITFKHFENGFLGNFLELFKVGDKSKNQKNPKNSSLKSKL